MRHYVLRQRTLLLHGWATRRLPEWFSKRFPAIYHRKRLLNESPDAMLHVGPFENWARVSVVAAPERTLLKILSEVGVRPRLQEAREIVEGAYGLRVDVLRELLRETKSVRTVRLALQLGRDLSLRCPPMLTALLGSSGTQVGCFGGQDKGALSRTPRLGTTQSTSPRCPG